MESKNQHQSDMESKHKDEHVVEESTSTTDNRDDSEEHLKTSGDDGKM